MGVPCSRGPEGELQASWSRTPATETERFARSEAVFHSLVQLLDVVGLEVNSGDAHYHR